MTDWTIITIHESIKKKLSFNHRSTVIELPNWRVQDIDTLEDWKRAELKYKILRSI